MPCCLTGASGNSSAPARQTRDRSASPYEAKQPFNSVKCCARRRPRALTARLPTGENRRPAWLRDAWTAGVFGPYVLVVWVGRFDGAANPGFNGLHAATPIFFSIRRSLEALNPTGALPDPAADDGGLNIRRILSARPGRYGPQPLPGTIAPDRHLVHPRHLAHPLFGHSATHPGG